MGLPLMSDALPRERQQAESERVSPKHPAQSLNALKSMPVPLRCAPRDGLTTEGSYAVPLPDRDEALSLPMCHQGQKIRIVRSEFGGYG